MNNTSQPVLMNGDLPLPVCVRGKVRDTFDLGNVLLIIATDRISAFDVVLPCGIPNKGRVLNQFSIFWFDVVITPSKVHEGYSTHGP